MKKFKVQPKREPVSKTIRLQEEVWEELETIASRNNMSVNFLVSLMIEYSLENMDTSEDE